jgi:hypothetical protein
MSAYDGDMKLINYCDESAYSCLCSRPPGHDGPHACPCGGSWNGSAEDDTFDVVTFPPGIPVGPARDMR